MQHSLGALLHHSPPRLPLPSPLSSHPGLVEEEWLTTLASVDPDEVRYLDFVAEARRLAAELRVGGRRGGILSAALGRSTGLRAQAAPQGRRSALPCGVHTCSVPRGGLLAQCALACLPSSTRPHVPTPTAPCWLATTRFQCTRRACPHRSLMCLSRPPLLAVPVPTAPGHAHPSPPLPVVLVPPHRSWPCRHRAPSWSSPSPTCAFPTTSAWRRAHRRSTWCSEGMAKVE